MRDFVTNKPNIYECQRINSILDAAWEKHVIFITAPMGYGKSTFIKEYVKKQNPEIEQWFCFGNYENANTMFLSEVRSLFIRCNIPCEYTSQMSLDRMSSFELLEYIKFFKKYIQKETICILEDFHLCRSSSIYKIIEFVAQAEIDKLHLIVLERYYPDIPYVEMKIKNYCELIVQKDLMLTKEDIFNFFLSNGISLSDKDLQLSVQYSDGWIAAVYLLYLDYLQHGFISDKTSIAKLIKTSIYNKLSPLERTILIKIHLTNCCTPEQAIYLTENELAASILMRLSKDNGFISYVEDKGFVIHTMLKSIIREDAFLQGIRKEELLTPIISWYKSLGNYTKMLPLMLELDQFDAIFDILISENANQIYQDGLLVLRECFNGIPIEYKVKYLSVYMNFILIYITRINFEEGMLLFNTILDYMKDSIYLYENDKTVSQVALLETIKHFNNVDEMISVCNKVLDLITEESFKTYLEDLSSMFAVPYVLRTLHHKLGHLKDLTDLLLYTPHLDTEEDLSNKNRHFSIMEAEYLYEIGDLTSAYQKAQGCLSKAIEEHNLIALLPCYRILIQYHLLLGNMHEVKKYFDEIELLSKSNVHEPFQEGCNLLRAALYCDINLFENKKEKYNNGNDDSYYEKELSHMKIKKYNHVVKLSGILSGVYGNLLLYQKKYSELELLALDLLKGCDTHTFLFREIEGRLFLIISHYQCGKVDEAKSELEFLLAMCSKDWLIMVFVECAKELKPILEQIHLDEFGEAVLKKCNECLEIVNNNKNQNKELPFSLTERERELIILLSKGMKNTEIADSLHIAKITVEKALSSIYKKLDVKNRAGAIAKYNEYIKQNES